MANARIRAVVRRIRHTALFDSGGLSDGDLLERYLSQREEAALEALVRRLGPMVLGVCRRNLRDAHDADDAFQATFLVLLRKAHTIMPRDRVGAWLYGVAHRIALKAGAMNRRRRARQKALADLAGPPARGEDDWLALLDREIKRLPEKYRLPIVLCDLEHKTRKQAARALGWPEGTVATRLQHGRALVQKRLAGQGLALSAAAKTLAWAESVAAHAVPAPLLTATVHCASLFAAGPAAGLVPVKLVTLAEGALRAMVVTRIKCISLVLAVVTVLGLGGWAGVTRSAVQAQQFAPQPHGKEPAGAPVQADRVVVSGTVERGAGLPTGPTPQQALVSLDRDKLVVKTNRAYYEPKQVKDAAGRQVTTYAVRNYMETNRYEVQTVEVYDMKRRKLDNLDMAQWLRQEIPALLLVGTRDIDPLHLRLIKDGTLIFVVPGRDNPPGTVIGSPAAPEGAPANGALATDPLPSTVPNPAADPFKKPALPPLAAPPLVPPEVRNQQAEHDLAIAQFYAKTGKLGSATFYGDLIQRRYPGTSYAPRAAALLRTLRGADGQPPAAQTAARIGEIIIVGNERIPSEAILENCPLLPGQVLDMKDVRTAEKTLDNFKWHNLEMRAAVAVVDIDRVAGFKDILITVQEWLPGSIAAEFKKLNGTWKLMSAAVDGVTPAVLLGMEYTFDGSRLTAHRNQKTTTRSVVLDPSRSPPGIRWLAANDSEEELVGTYLLKEDTLVLNLRSPRASEQHHPMKLTLKRKRAQGGSAPRSEDGAKTEERLRGTFPDLDLSRVTIKLHNPVTGFALVADTITILDDGRVKLTKAAISHQKNGVPAVVRGEQILLELDGPVNAVADLLQRNILSLQVDGTIQIR